VSQARRIRRVVRASIRRQGERVFGREQVMLVLSTHRATTSAECKQDEAKALVVQHGDLSVPIRGRMFFAWQRRERRPEIEPILRSCEPHRRRRPQSII
jgi:hypothetical protein